MATVAVLAAMPSEMRPFVKATGLAPGDGGIFTGAVGDHDVVATTTGIGTALARRHTGRLFEHARPDHVIVIGIAGGVSDDLSIGDLVVPEVVRDDATGAERTPHPLGGHRRGGTLLTTDQLYVDPEAVERLRRQGVVALDMETAAMAEVCEAHGTPWSVFRALSDRADGGLVDDRVAGLTRPDGSPDPGAVARLLLTRPWTVRRLSRLAADAKKAYATSVRTAVEVLRTARFDERTPR